MARSTSRGNHCKGLTVNTLSFSASASFQLAMSLNWGLANQTHNRLRHGSATSNHQTQQTTSCIFKDKSYSLTIVVVSSLCSIVSLNCYVTVALSTASYMPFNSGYCHRNTPHTRISILAIVFWPVWMASTMYTKPITANHHSLLATHLC